MRFLRKNQESREILNFKVPFCFARRLTRCLLDNRVHVVLYFIEPNGHSLKETDIEFMRCISRRANVIPVISKSDSMTKYELIAFKQQVIYQMRI